MNSLKFNMKRGSRGQEVRRLQRKLGIKPTGKFGPTTRQVVREFQDRQGLAVDGVAGQRTQRALGIEVLPGIDVSDYNKITDWQAVYDHGVRWCYIKASEGTTHDQKKVFDHAKRARDAGLEVGFYHFSRPDTYMHKGLQDARDEAHNMLDDLQRNDVPYTLPFCNDMEKADKKRDGYNINWALEFARVVKEEEGHTPILYTAHWFINGWFNHKDIDKLVKTHHLWLADYDGYPDDEIAPWPEWLLTQYTGHGYIPGAKGRIDLNWAAGEAMDKLLIKEQC